MSARILLLSAATALPLQAAMAEGTSVPAAAAPFSFETTPGRLPKNVVPTDYVIALTPHAATHKVEGTESITLDFTQAADKIQFNSLNQSLSHVLFDGKPVKSVHSDDKAQLTTIMLARAAKAGWHKLAFSYVGKIETEPHGFVVRFEHGLLLRKLFVEQLVDHAHVEVEQCCQGAGVDDVAQQHAVAIAHERLHAHLAARHA